MPFVGASCCPTRYQPTPLRAGGAAHLTRERTGRGEAGPPRGSHAGGCVRPRVSGTSEQVGAAPVSELVDDGLHGLRAVAARHEDGVGGQRDGHVGHADEGDEGPLAVLREGSEDCRAIGFDAQRLAQVAAARDDASEGLEVAEIRPTQLGVCASAGTTATPPSAATGSAIAWSMAIFVRCGQLSASTSSNPGVPHARAMVSRRACMSGSRRARWTASTPADTMNMPAFHR